MIRINNGALDTIEINGEVSLALRGVIDPTHLQNILTPDYQREVLSAGKTAVLKEALRTSRVPDIDLGMRGGNATEHTDADGRTYWLLDDDVYVIDGLQRKTAGERLVDEGFMPHIGVIVHFDTNEGWERKRFEALNVGQTGLSSNVTLRNLAQDFTGAKIMLDITKDPKFILCNKITWAQNMRKGDLLTAISFYKIVGRLHSHLGPGKSNPPSLARTGVLKIIKNSTKTSYQQNVISFFDLVDECFNIKDVAYRKSATHLKTSFLLALAGVLSDHEDFWDGYSLAVPLDLRRKLAKFPITDPSVVTLAGSSGMSIRTLEMLIVDHINAGKRTRHLKRRATADEVENTDELSA